VSPLNVWTINGRKSKELHSFIIVREETTKKPTMALTNAYSRETFPWKNIVDSSRRNGAKIKVSKLRMQ